MGLSDIFWPNLEKLKTNNDKNALKKFFLDKNKSLEDRRKALRYLQELGYSPDSINEKVNIAVLNGEFDKIKPDDESIPVLVSLLFSDYVDLKNPDPIHEEYKLKIISKILENRSELGKKYARQFLNEGYLWAFFKESQHCGLLDKNSSSYSAKYHDYVEKIWKECVRYFAVPENKIENYYVLITQLNTLRARGFAYDPMFIDINANSIIFQGIRSGIQTGFISLRDLAFVLCRIGIEKGEGGNLEKLMHFHWKNVEFGDKIIITTLDDTSDDMSIKHTFNAWILNSFNKNEEALSHCEIALSLNKNNPYAWHNKGILLRKKKQIEEAQKCFDTAYSLDKDYKKPKFKPIETCMEGKK
jgi:tetratricopeptide (TPR) repeat protein